MSATKFATSHSLRTIIVAVVHDGACLSNLVANNDDNAALCLYYVDMNNWSCIRLPYCHPSFLFPNQHYGESNNHLAIPSGMEITSPMSLESNPKHPVMVAAPTITIMGLKWTRRKGWERDFACFPHSDIACYGNIALMVFRSWKQKTRSILSSYSPPSMESGPSSVHWHPFLFSPHLSSLSFDWNTGSGGEGVNGRKRHRSHRSPLREFSQKMRKEIWRHLRKIEWGRKRLSASRDSRLIGHYSHNLQWNDRWAKNLWLSTSGMVVFTQEIRLYQN